MQRLINFIKHKIDSAVNADTDERAQHTSLTDPLCSNNSSTTFSSSFVKLIFAVTSTIATIILVLSFINFVKPQATYSNTENRPLATKPTLSVDSLLSSSYTSELQTSYNDQFIGRDGLVSLAP